MFAMMELPDSILTRIVNQLSLKDAISVSCASKRLRLVAVHTVLPWHKMALNIDTCTSVTGECKDRAEAFARFLGLGHVRNGVRNLEIRLQVWAQLERAE